MVWITDAATWRKFCPPRWKRVDDRLWLSYTTVVKDIWKVLEGGFLKATQYRF